MTDEIPVGTYRYRIRSTGASSQKYGPCEVCGEHASEMFSQVEERRYKRAAKIRPEMDDYGWTQHECYSFYGHKECLIGKRRNPRVEEPS